MSNCDVNLIFLSINSFYCVKIDGQFHSKLFSVFNFLIVVGETNISLLYFCTEGLKQLPLFPPCKSGPDCLVKSWPMPTKSQIKEVLCDSRMKLLQVRQRIKPEFHLH